jgi:hypothetical protein
VIRYVQRQNYNSPVGNQAYPPDCDFMGGMDQNCGGIAAEIWLIQYY